MQPLFQWIDFFICQTYSHVFFSSDNRARPKGINHELGRQESRRKKPLSIVEVEVGETVEAFDGLCYKIEDTDVEA
ncbi:hypothetical protein AtNW77_Chr1g0030271 [Arabidopsis thaliana]